MQVACFLIVPNPYVLRGLSLVCFFQTDKYILQQLKNSYGKYRLNVIIETVLVSCSQSTDFGEKLGWVIISIG